MKKVLATVAALGLVLGVTANALALDKPGRASEVESVTEPVVAKATAPGVALWSVSGQWVLAGAYLSKGLGAPGGADVYRHQDENQSSNDAFYIYSFKILPVLQINDKIAVKGELRFADRDVFGLTNTVFQLSDGKAGGRIMDTYTVYMEWMSPVGKTRFGRTPAGAWGTSKWNNSTRQGDRLMWWPNMLPEGMGMLVFTEKLSEQDAAGSEGSYTDIFGDPHFEPGYVSDGDSDAYYIDFSYTADVGKTVGAIWAVRNATNGEAAGGPDTYTSMNLWLNGKYAFAGSWGLEWEADIGFGEATPTRDQKSLGFMADLNMVSGDWKFGALYYYGSGSDGKGGPQGDSETFMASSKGMGRDYNPYQIMNGDYMNMLNADNPLSGNTINPALIQADGTNVGAWSLGIYAGFKVSPKLTLSGEIGYFGANETLASYDFHCDEDGENCLDSFDFSGQDKDLGWEIGLGMSYKLYDNLDYVAHFSYLLTGDYFKLGAEEFKTEDVYLFAHALSMKF